MSPTHDMIIDNSTGANVRADINNALAALVSNSSSSSEPATKYAYMWWADTTNGILKIRNSANNAWVELLQLDGTLTLEDGSASSPALSFRDDLNTGVYSAAADRFNIAAGGVDYLEIKSSLIVFNDTGADTDFKIEGDTDANLFYVDAGNNRVGIGTSSPSTKLDIAGDVTITSTQPKLFLTDTNNNSDFTVQNANGNFSIVDETNSATRLLIDATGGIVTGGASSPASSDIGNLYIKNASAIGSVSHQLNVATNAVFNGGWKYIAGSVGATQLAINQSGYFFSTAGSGSAGGSATFTNRFTVAHDGDCTVSDGNLVIGTAGHGIDFSATSHVTGVESELFNDYEQGTWVPSFTSGVSGGGYQVQSGNYTKVGRLVMISCRIDGNGLSATADNLLIGGLPFTSTSSNTAGGMYFAFSDNFYSQTSGTNLALTIIVNNNATVCEVFNGDGTQQKGNDMSDVNRNIHLVGSYHAA